MDILWLDLAWEGFGCFRSRGVWVQVPPAAPLGKVPDSQPDCFALQGFKGRDLLPPTRARHQRRHFQPKANESPKLPLPRAAVRLRDRIREARPKSP